MWGGCAGGSPRGRSLFVGMTVAVVAGLRGVLGGLADVPGGW